MCGITGIYKFNESEISEMTLVSMTESLKHRGPDSGSVWIGKKVGFGHRLLKIQDLSDNSVQPISYKEWVLTYNGEVYNFQELKNELKEKGYTFDTISDTEVVIKSFDCWGIDCISKFNGFFAFAIYNKNTEELYLVRDRYGIKPLYYIEMEKTELLFASEIKSILKNSKVKTKFNYDMLGIAIACNLWLSPNQSYFESIKLLEAGNYLKCDRLGVKKYQYYFIKNVLQDMSEKELVDSLKFIINDSVKSKLISQVPIAGFLSGGIDSSLICKLAKDNYQSRFSTYTIYYSKDDEDYLYSRKLAEKENFNANYTYVSPEDYSIENIDKVIYHMEEVPVDKVYVPIYLNYKVASKDNYRVILNGQGSDEPWLGYIFRWDIFNQLGDRFSADFLLDFYMGEKMIFKNKLRPDFLLKTRNAIKQHLRDNLFKYLSKDQLNSYSIFAIKTIMHNLLLQEDKLGMASSVECRVPFVDDHRIIELSLGTPSSAKTKDGREKYVVRQGSKFILTDYIINRPKHPFAEPLANSYDVQIKSICLNNWLSICQSKILRNIFKDNILDEINNFSAKELWWILNMWRFEEVFNIS